MLLIVVLAYIFAAAGVGFAIPIAAWFSLHWFITLLLVLFFA